MRTLWQRLITFGFRLLYNELAWLYDPVSWLVSKGLWRKWQRTALAYLPASGTVLEVGFGPGHILVEMAERDFQPIGLDLSPAMLRQARRRLARRTLDVPLCRGQAEALPFSPQRFDAVLLTFPTPFVYDPGWMCGLARVLKPGGRLVVVEMVAFDRHSRPWRSLDRLYQVTGQRGPVPELCNLLDAAGLSARRTEIRIEKTIVSLVVADKQTTKSHDDE